MIALCGISFLPIPEILHKIKGYCRFPSTSWKFSRPYVTSYKNNIKKKTWKEVHISYRMMWLEIPDVHHILWTLYSSTTRTDLHQTFMVRSRAEQSKSTAHDMDSTVIHSLIISQIDSSHISQLNAHTPDEKKNKKTKVEKTLTQSS